VVGGFFAGFTVHKFLPSAPAEACMADPLRFVIKRWFEEDDTALRRILGDIASDEERHQDLLKLVIDHVS